MGKLKSFMILLLVAGLVLSTEVVSYAAEDVVGKHFYTVINMWYSKPAPIDSTNYHRGVIIPVGTKVKITEVNDGSGPMRNALGPGVDERYIRFDLEGGESCRVAFNSRRARPGTTVWSLFRDYFSENDPMAEGGAFRSFSPEEQKNILLGEIAEGMSKAAVVMAYGYPPGHRTPSLASDTWVYWDTHSRTRTVFFESEKVHEVEGPERKSRRKERRREPRKKTETTGIAECVKVCRDNTKRSAEQCFDACNK